MISHRRRALVAGVPIVVLATVLISSPGFAVGTLTVSTPISGSTVSGLAAVEGSVGGDDPAVITLGLAPQTLGDCGVVLIDKQVALLDSQFSASIATTAVPDGDYCLIAVAGDGRLSTVVGDITVNNTLSSGESLAGMQLPTESLGGYGTEEGVEAPVTPAAESAAPFASATMLGVIALAVTGVLALLVLGLGLWVRIRTA